MKKILSSALALIMLLSCLSVTAFAAENPTTTDKGATITATGSYVPNVVSQVVSLDVAWGAMTFTFSSNTNWDPSTHTSSGTSGWTAEGNDITLTNHSNADIVAKLNFYSEINGLGGNFYDAAENGNAITDVTLATADGTSVAEAPAKTIYFRMEQGEITQDEANLGTVYLTISDSQTSTHEWVNGTCTICKKTMVTTEVSGSTLILTIPANVYHPSIATAMEEVSRNDQITAFVVKGSVTSAQYDIVKNGRNGAAVFFTDLQTNNYISAAGNTYTCTLGSASDEKYVLIANILRSDIEENDAAYGGDGSYGRFVDTLTTTDPGARAISVSETAWSVYQSMVVSAERTDDITYLLLGDTMWGSYKESNSAWHTTSWNGHWTERLFYWFPVFDVPLS